MSQYGNKATFVEGTANPKRRAAKKARGFGQGKVNPAGLTGDDGKHLLDTWSQSHDPLFKVKGKERHRRMKL